MTAPDSISLEVRRLFILGKQGLWPARRWAGKDGTAVGLKAIEGVQVDPVTLVAQSQDIVLWSRVDGYRPACLVELLYNERRFFEYGGALFIYPIEELPYWRVRMERRKLEPRWADFAAENPGLLDAVRERVRVGGPARSRDLEGVAIGSYRARRDTGLALYYLWLTGELMISQRQGKERVYDLMERVAPPHLLSTAAESDAICFFTRKAISHLGLVDDREFRNILKSAHGRPVAKKEATQRIADMIESGLLHSVSCEGRQHYLLAPDVAPLAELAEGKVPSAWRPVRATRPPEVVFLSPLDYVSARGRAKRLFDFDYTWEIYKPAAKRIYGPYTLPILYEGRLVGRMDAKLDRATGILSIRGLWTEAWFEPDDAFWEAYGLGLGRFAAFLDADDVDLDAAVSPALREQIHACLHTGHSATR